MSEETAVGDVERRLREALGDPVSRPDPSPDLFGRVRDVVAADRRRRRRRAVAVVSAALTTAVLTAALLLSGAVDLSAVRPLRGGAMSWWVLELAVNVLLVALALWLGPFIKRFGRAYAADVFHDNPLTGKSYLVLADIVYYLIFCSYILFTLRLEPTWGRTVVSAEQVQYSAGRVAGILLVMGVLHGLNLVLMPVLGRVFSLNRRLQPPTTLAPSQREVIGDERR
ncbi:hypothetical protein [Aquipuribacter sp. SD81]|uniref:hypothetical protein n=1 Tax=Aquipuribacter sp. SD81 TaxID=3127703 RepID=UPI003016AA10